MVNYSRNEEETKEVKDLVRYGPGAYEEMSLEEFDRRIHSNPRYREAVRKEIERRSREELLRKNN